MKIITLILCLVYATNTFAGFIIDVMGNTTATTTSTEIVEGVASRSYFLLVNNGANPVYLKIGSYQTGNEGILIPSGGSYEPVVPPSDAIMVKTATGTSSITVVTGKEP